MRRELRGLSRALCALALLVCARPSTGAGRADLSPRDDRPRGREAPLVVLDPGHGPAHRGAVSARGLDEVTYNDAFAALLAPKLAAAGFRVERTRAPGEEPGLDARARTASERGAWLLLSLHHDSAQEPLLARAEVDGRPAWRTLRPIRGYSIFVSGRNARYAASLRAAQALGRRLAALGRPPTLHHAEPIPGENRPLLDPALGIYRFDDLKVVRLATCPAVLIELGVLPDEADEAYVSDPARQEAIAEAIVAALVEVRDASPVHSADQESAARPVPASETQ